MTFLLHCASKFSYPHNYVVIYLFAFQHIRLVLRLKYTIEYMSKTTNGGNIEGCQPCITIVNISDGYQIYVLCSFVFRSFDHYTSPLFYVTTVFIHLYAHTAYNRAAVTSGGNRRPAFQRLQVQLVLGLTVPHVRDDNGSAPTLVFNCSPALNRSITPEYPIK